MKKILLLSVIIRLICLYLFRNVNNYDLESYTLVGRMTLSGVSVYPAIARLHYPYLPFYLYLEAFATWLSHIGLISPISLIKLVNIIFDLGIVYMVYILSRKNLKTAFLYATNPVTILITTLHGQFDVIPLFFILLTIHLSNLKKELPAILSYSLAILVKTWPILFVLPVIRKINNKRLIFLIGSFPLFFLIVYSSIFKTRITDILGIVFNYQGLWGIWGLWSLVGHWPVLWQKISTFIFLFAFFIYSLFTRKTNTVEEFFKLLFFFFIFTTNFSIQYFVWIIPFLYLIKPNKYFVLVVLISVYIFSFYYMWLFCRRCMDIPYWLIISQNVLGFIVWLSFVKFMCLLKKCS